MVNSLPIFAGNVVTSSFECPIRANFTGTTRSPVGWTVPSIPESFHHPHALVAACCWSRDRLHARTAESAKMWIDDLVIGCELKTRWASPFCNPRMNQISNQKPLFDPDFCENRCPCLHECEKRKMLCPIPTSHRKRCDLWWLSVRASETEEIRR